ncbi:MAG: D-tyrosyl-tRNA(Tyr) deacylase [Nitrospirae bacterium]|nr:D-tyrosyl-tRNA(Tyr) deacylase [Nitrospirota bacterium]MBI5695672.1 D-tyrosyl-tRNA(Tyr) deacylase [Nitrospirota bacterium]
MRAVVQRVKNARVTVDGAAVSEIGHGLLVLLGVEKYDKEADADYLLKKIVELRIFSDADGKFNHCLTDVGGEIMIISQFTICGDARKGRRPSFTDAEKGKQAEELYEYMVYMAKDMGLKVGEGRFGAHMEVSLVNDGPVTMLLDSGKLF